MTGRYGSGTSGLTPDWSTNSCRKLPRKIPVQNRKIHRCLLSQRDLRNLYNKNKNKLWFTKYLFILFQKFSWTYYTILSLSSRWKQLNNFWQFSRFSQHLLKYYRVQLRKNIRYIYDQSAGLETSWPVFLGGLGSIGDPSGFQPKGSALTVLHFFSLSSRQIFPLFSFRSKFKNYNLIKKMKLQQSDIKTFTCRPNRHRHGRCRDRLSKVCQLYHKRNYCVQVRTLSYLSMMSSLSSWQSVMTISTLLQDIMSSWYVIIFFKYDVMVRYLTSVGRPHDGVIISPPTIRIEGITLVDAHKTEAVSLRPTVKNMSENDNHHVPKSQISMISQKVFQWRYRIETS